MEIWPLAPPLPDVKATGVEVRGVTVWVTASVAVAEPPFAPLGAASAQAQS